MNLILQEVNNRNGTCVNVKENLALLCGWESKVDIICDKGHKWSATVCNLLQTKTKTWCKQCKIESTAFKEEQLHNTAKNFNGLFLGLVPQLSPGCSYK